MPSDHYRIIESAVSAEVSRLVEAGFISQDNNGEFTPEQGSKLMAKFYLQFATISEFHEILRCINLRSVLYIIASAEEFKSILVRMGEKKILNELNKSVKFPLEGKVKTIADKIFVILQAHLGHIPIGNFHLSNDATHCAKIAERISACMIEFLVEEVDVFLPLVFVLKLHRYFHRNSWATPEHILRQVEGIGDKYAKVLVSKGVTSLSQLASLNTCDIQRMLDRRAPFGTDLIDRLRVFPVLEATASFALGEHRSAQVKVLLHQTKRDFLTRKWEGGIVVLAGISGYRIHYQKIKLPNGEFPTSLTILNSTDWHALFTSNTLYSQWSPR